MTVYDFDKTVFYPDSSAQFIKFCFTRYPLEVFGAVVGSIPRAVWYILHGRSDATALKERLFSFLGKIDDIDGVLSDFWEENAERIGKWYLDMRRSDDVIISASPEFLHRPIADRLGFQLIGTKMDKKTGRIDGLNCQGTEKVRRFREIFPDVNPEKFFSDSLSDTPMAMIADKAFIVKRGTLSVWQCK